MGAVRRRAPYTVRRLPALWKSRLGVDCQPLTYGDLIDHLKTIMGGLRRLGIRRNDRVAIVLPNRPGIAHDFSGRLLCGNERSAQSGLLVGRI